jgi:hypothetical protein
MHQGWPKFVEYGLWGKDKDGLVCLAYTPNKIATTLSTKTGEIPIEIEETTTYPFSDKIYFTLQLGDSTEFTLKFRIPGWCSESTIKINENPPISCDSGTFFNISRIWKSGDEIELSLPSTTINERRFNDSVSIIKGPLLFAYNPEEEHVEQQRWSKAAMLRKNSSIEIPHQVKDWEIVPKSSWEFALVEPIEPLVVKMQDNIELFRSFSNRHPPIFIKVNAVEIENWTLEFQAAAPPPKNPIPKSDITKEIKLIPYGCTNIRISEFPRIKNSGINVKSRESSDV